MRNYLLIATTIALLAPQFGCGGREQKEKDATPKATAKAPDQAKFLEPPYGDDSPIIVGSGSLHTRQYSDAIHMTDTKNGYVDISDHAVHEVDFGICPIGKPVGIGFITGDC